MRSHCSPASATAPGPPASRRVSGPARSWNSSDDGEPSARAEPGGLDPLGDGAVPVPGAGATGRAGGGAVGEEVEQGRRPRQESSPDGEPAERDRAEVPDDRGVDQQVQRLGREDDERGNGEGQHEGRVTPAIMAP